MAVGRSEQDQWREYVRQEWTDVGIVAAWRKWHPEFAQATRELTDLLIAEAQLAPGMHILDIASGTGEPALTIATLVGSAGHVTATDISDGRLAAAEDNARRAGLTNLSFQVADAEALPFPDATFDRVTSRLGVMYFADVQQGLSEIRRVLKPDSLATLVAIGPYDEATTITSTVGVLLKYVSLPPPGPGPPNPFQFAEAGTLAAAMRAAGFMAVQEASHSIRLVWPGTAENYWQQFEEIAAPFRAYVDALPAEQREEAIRNVLDSIRQYEEGGRLHFTLTAIVATGLREAVAT
jgi:SAM-dependent methyltransferase